MVVVEMAVVEMTMAEKASPEKSLLIKQATSASISESRSSLAKKGVLA